MFYVSVNVLFCPGIEGALEAYRYMSSKVNPLTPQLICLHPIHIHVNIAYTIKVVSSNN